MRTFLTYFILEYKKSIKVLLKSFGSTLMMLLLVIAGAWAVSHFVFQSHIFQPVKVGMVIDENDEKVKMITKLVSAMESVESICEFVYVDEDEAKKLLAKEELSAAIILPENFYEDVDSGYNTPVTVYVSGNVSLNQRVFRELLTDGVSLLRTSEAGVYSVLSVAREYPAELSQKKIGNVISEIYIEEAFYRGRIFASEVSSALGEMDLYQYYFISAVTVFLLMSGLNYSFLYRKRTRAVEDKLKISGVGAFKVSVIKVIVMGNLLWLLSAGVYAAGCMISEKMKLNFLLFEGQTLLYLIPQCLAIAAYFHMLYAISGKSGQGAVIIFAANVFMILCSGAVIPVAYLPAAAGKIGSVLPLTFWNQYGAEAVFGQINVELLLVQAAIMLIATGIGAVASWKNT